MLARKLLWFSGLCLVLLFAAGCKKDKGLRIEKIEPDHGPAHGSSQITIHGSGFQSEGALGVKVYFGDKQGRNAHFQGDEKLIVDPPAGKKGDTVDLRIMFDDGRSKVIEAAYTYTDPAEGFGVDELTEGGKKEEEGE